MSTQTAAALLDAAIFSLQRARGELGGDAAPGAPPGEETPAREGALERFVRRYDALEASDYTPQQQADAYDDSAGVLRRRALRTGLTGDALAVTEERARYFEARAKCKRDGVPLPYGLRSTNERLGYVDALRRELAELVELAQLIHVDEIQSFTSMRMASPGAPEPEPTALNVGDVHNGFISVLGRLLETLGVYRDGETGALAFGAYRRVSPGPPPPAMPSEAPAPGASDAHAQANGAASSS